MLADEVEPEVAVGVGPEPVLGAVEAGTVLLSARETPEADSQVLTRDPLPVGRVLRVPHGAHPVLTVRVLPGGREIEDQ